MSVLGILGGIAGPVRDIFDELHTSDEEKAAAAVKLEEVLQKQRHDIEETIRLELDGRTDIIKAEMAQGDAFTKRARPSLVYWGMVLITLREIVDQVLALPVQIELLMVDDGSTDGSRDLLQEMARSDERVRVFLQDKNRGKGAAVRRGIQEATGDVVVIQDADLEYEPKDLIRMLEEMKRLDTPVIYGSRRLEGRSKSAQATYYMGGVLLSWITNLLYGSRITDEPTCYKMWKRELIQSIPLVCNGFEFCPEVTAKVLKRGHKIPEIHITYRPRSTEEGKKIRLRDGLIAIWTLVKFRFRG